MDALPADVVIQIVTQATDAWHDRTTIHAMRTSCKCMRNAFDSTNLRLTLGGRMPFPEWEDGPETSLPGFIPQIPALLSRTLNLQYLRVSVPTEFIY